MSGGVPETIDVRKVAIGDGQTALFHRLKTSFDENQALIVAAIAVGNGRAFDFSFYSYADKTIIKHKTTPW